LLFPRGPRELVVDHIRDIDFSPYTCRALSVRRASLGRPVPQGHIRRDLACRCLIFHTQPGASAAFFMYFVPK